MALFCGLGEPGEGFAVILFDAVAIAIEQADVDLRFGVSLFGGAPEQSRPRAGRAARRARARRRTRS
jgi:hypothetical protein